jgi:hypothetical protein
VSIWLARHKAGHFRRHDADDPELDRIRLRVGSRLARIEHDDHRLRLELDRRPDHVGAVQLVQPVPIRDNRDGLAFKLVLGKLESAAGQQFRPYQLEEAPRHQLERDDVFALAPLGACQRAGDAVERSRIFVHPFDELVRDADEARAVELAYRHDPTTPLDSRMRTERQIDVEG